MCGTQQHRPTTTATVPADDVRASDAERERVISDLRTHAGDGRLGVDDLATRIDAVYAATTRRELAALTADLPRAPRPRRDERADLRDHVRSYAGVMVLLVVIWALTGMGYFWPVWPALGWGIGIVSHAGSVLRRPPRRAVA